MSGAPAPSPSAHGLTGDKEETEAEELRTEAATTSLSHNPGHLTNGIIPLGSHAPNSSAKSGLVYPRMQNLPFPKPLHRPSANALCTHGLVQRTQPSRMEGPRSLRQVLPWCSLARPRASVTYLCHSGALPHSIPCSRGGQGTTSPQPPPTAEIPSQGGEPRSASKTKRDNERDRIG